MNLSNKSNTSVKIWGYVENMQDFLQASDVVLGKPGASQTFECLVKKKPIIYTTYMENELSTMKFVLENNFGWYVKNKKDFIKLLNNILKKPDLLKKKSQKMIKIRSCSDDIAKFIDKKLSNKKNYGKGIF